MHARGALERVRVWGVLATQVISISHGAAICLLVVILRFLGVLCLYGVYQCVLVPALTQSELLGFYPIGSYPATRARTRRRVPEML